MSERKRRASQNNRLLRLLIERLRDYSLDEVGIICNKFCKRHNIEQKRLDKLILEYQNKNTSQKNNNS